MKLEGEYVFDASIAEVWAALFDPVVLAATLPGCEKLELVDGQYEGELNVKVGPIQGKFMGKVELKDIDEPNGYTMVIDGRGAPGFVNATATVKLDTAAPGTRIRYAADAQIGGKIASVGQRLIEASARAIVKQSLDGLNENVKLRAAAYRESRVNEPATAAAENIDVQSATPTPPASPQYKFTPVRAKQSALAASVAKEVLKTVLPVFLIVAVVTAIVLWLVLR